MSPTLQLVIGAGAAVGLAALGACAARQRPRPSASQAGDPPPDVAVVVTSARPVPPIDAAAATVPHRTATFALG